ncbi:MAG: LabA-like NYN domain-containing protein [Limisphaerales bacterium]
MAAGGQKAPGLNRTLIFVDEGNLTGICSKLNRSIDWLNLREQLSRDRDVLEVFIYAGLPPSTAEWSEFRIKRERFLHWLESEAFYVVRKQGRPTTQQAYKANVDVMMATEAMELAIEVKPNTIILVTGDGDFGFVACKLRRRGIRVEVAAFENNLGEDLRISASAFIDLSRIIKAVDYKSASDDHPRTGVETGIVGNS